MLPKTSLEDRLPVRKNSASALEIGTVYRNEDGEYIIRRGDIRI